MEDGNEETDESWQSAPAKKRYASSPVKDTNKKRREDIEKSKPVNNNRFALLNNESNEEDTEGTTAKVPKPPPIYIPDVKNISKMIENFCSVILRNDFNYKSTRDGHIRVMVENVDSYRKLTKHLEQSKVSFHTYQLKQERSFRFVIKGMHHTTPVESIKAELIILGHQVRNVTNAKSKVTKQPLSMFFVEVDPCTNNKDVYDIRYLSNAVITVEPLKKTNDLVQCYRCQQFGHTQSYCKKAYRCVKCASDHPTAECTNSANSPPRCVHCLQNHTASYKGCQVYQQLVQKKTTRSHILTNITRTNPISSTQVRQQQPTVTLGDSPNLSYAEAVRGDNCINSEKSLFTKMEVMINKQNELMNTMLQMMQMIISKICN